MTKVRKIAAGVPESFRKEPGRKPVRTVGALIKELQRLPPRMRLCPEDEDGYVVVVYNAMENAPGPCRAAIEEAY